MKNDSFLMINTSVLYRCMQKYYDRQLAPYQIGSGQLQFLILIYEHEGISMQTLAQMGCFDKGTVTKGIQKLEEQGYIKSMLSKEDRRIRCLYTTDKAKQEISKMYFVRREWWDHLTKGLSQEEIDIFEGIQRKMKENALHYMNESSDMMKVFGLQKLTLLDYPGRIGSTVFSGGCNFRCPYCQNSDLVFLPENTSQLDQSEIMTFYKKRKNVLEGICISGGEPLLQPGLEEFLRELKVLGYPIKLDTNGSQPKKLKDLIEKGLVDYVAVDIKNSKQKYGRTIGIETFDIAPIEETVKYLMQGNIPYEFRTTVVEEFHEENDMEQIGQWLKGAKAYYIQNFVDSERVILSGLHSVSEERLQRFLEIVSKSIPNSRIRGNS